MSDAIPANSPDLDERSARNIANFIRFQHEVIVAGDFSVFDDLVAPDAVAERAANVNIRRLITGHAHSDPTHYVRRDSFERAWAHVMTGREEHVRNIDIICASGDTVAARWTIEWRQVARYAGLRCHQGRIKIHEVGFIHFDAQGRIARCWFMSDPLDEWRQVRLQVNLSDEDLTATTPGRTNA